MKKLIFITTLMALSLNSFAMNKGGGNIKRNGEGTVVFGNAAPDLNVIPTEEIDGPGLDVSNDMACFQSGPIEYRAVSDCEVRLDYGYRAAIKVGEELLAKLDAGENLTLEKDFREILRNMPLGFSKEGTEAVDAALHSFSNKYEAQSYNEIFRKLGNALISKKAYIISYESEVIKPVVCVTSSGMSIQTEAFVEEKRYISDLIKDVAIANLMCDKAMK